MHLSTQVLAGTGLGSLTALLAGHWWVILLVAAIPTVHMVVDRAMIVWLIRTADRSSLSGKEVARIVSAAHRGGRGQMQESDATPV